MKIFDTIAVVLGAGHRDRHPRRPDAADAARAARHRRLRQGQEGPAQPRGIPHSRALDRLARGDRGNREVRRATPAISWSRTSSPTPPPSTGISSAYNSYFNRIKDAVEIKVAEAERDGLRAGRVVLGAVRELHRRPQGERRGRLELVRAARLCPTLAQQRYGPSSTACRLMDLIDARALAASAPGRCRSPRPRDIRRSGSPRPGANGILNGGARAA